MRELRAAHRPVPVEELARVLPDDADRFRRALEGLVTDGLAVASSDGYALPHA
jgi:A/G-specific adenine glycosylase